LLYIFFSTTDSDIGIKMELDFHMNMDVLLLKKDITNQLLVNT